MEKIGGIILSLKAGAWKPYKLYNVNYANFHDKISVAKDAREPSIETRGPKCLCLNYSLFSQFVVEAKTRD
mgnify:CR=1 FL=1